MLWLPGEVGGLLRQLLGVSAERIRTDIPHHPDLARHLWLVPARRRAHGCPGQADHRRRCRGFIRGGQLTLRGLSPIPAVYRGFPLDPDDDDDPYVFRIDLSEFGIDTGRAVIRQVLGKGTTALHIDFFPPSLQKRPATTNPRVWVTGTLCALTVAATAAAGRRLSRQQKGR